MATAAESIPYDPSRDALYHPERRPPLPMSDQWQSDAVAAEFARLSYFPFESSQEAKEVIENAVGTIGYANCGWFDDSRNPDDRQRLDAQGFGAVTRDGRAIIAFRGTQPDSLKDLLTDAKFFPIVWTGAGEVHMGFWNALRSILDQVNGWCNHVQIRNLTITGHSLGAAMATLLAGLKDDAALVTFGSPRVGDATFATSFKGREVRRYVDCKDIVTEVPLPPFFQHLDGLRYIDHVGIIHDAEHPVPSLWTDHVLADGAYLSSMWQLDNVHLRSFADHAPINYVSAVRGLRIGP